MLTGIFPGNLDDPRVIALLDVHRKSALMATPADGALATYLSRLRELEVTVWEVWDADPMSGGTLLGVGALSELSHDQGEVKHMHTAEAARRKGVGSMMLGHIVKVARERGYSRISLETGSRDAFAPARALYRAYGFVDCGPFGDYEPHPISAFMTLDLGEETRNRT